MDLSLVVAMDARRLIGQDGGLPWRLPADLQHFKDVTMGKPVLMGRRTFESIGRALPGRRNLIWTSATELGVANVEVVHSLEEAMELVRASDALELMVIGGAAVYAAALPLATHLYLTEVDGEFEGDTWFPALEDDQWHERSSRRHAADADNPHAFRVRVLERREEAAGS